MYLTFLVQLLLKMLTLLTIHSIDKLTENALRLGFVLITGLLLMSEIFCSGIYVSSLLIYSFLRTHVSLIMTFRVDDHVPA